MRDETLSRNAEKQPRKYPRERHKTVFLERERGMYLATYPLQKRMGETAHCQTLRSTHCGDCDHCGRDTQIETHKTLEGHLDNNRDIFGDAVCENLITTHHGRNLLIRCFQQSRCGTAHLRPSLRRCNVCPAYQTDWKTSPSRHAHGISQRTMRMFWTASGNFTKMDGSSTGKSQAGISSSIQASNQRAGTANPRTTPKETLKR